MTLHSNPLLAPGGAPLIARQHEVNAMFARNDDAAAANRTGITEAVPDQAGRREATPDATIAPAALVSEEQARGSGSEGDGALPFIGTIVAHMPGQAIHVKRLLNLADDLYLADHHFVHAPGVKPLAACFPVVPMTFSLEIMAEVAACLAPGLGLSGFQNVSAGRWLALEDSETLTLHIEAKTESDPRPGSRRLAVSIRIDGAPQPAVSATLLFGQQYQHTLEYAIAPSPMLVRLFAAPLYEQRELFHGPSLQCLDGAIDIGRDGASAALSVKAPDQLFHATGCPQLLTDPALLDGIGQLIAIWARQQNYVAFPIGLGKLELYGPTPEAGTRVPIRLFVTADDIKTLHVDVEIGDGTGGVWLRIKDWKSWKFRWDRQLLDFRRMPSRHLLCDRFEWSSTPAQRDAPAPSIVAPDSEPRSITGHTVAQRSVVQRSVVQRIGARRIAGFDRALLARHYLTVSEMQRFAAMSGQRAHQLLWLLGRIAAKDAIRSWRGGDASGALPHPAAFGLGNDERGRPYIVDWPQQLGRQPSLSIAHCEQQAIALVDAHAVGIDIERIAERDPTFLEAISSHAERSLLAPVLQSARAEWITRLWCAKEVLGKLIGTGINQAPCNFEAYRIDARDGSLQLRHRSQDVDVLVRTVRDGDFMIAFALAESGQS